MATEISDSLKVLYSASIEQLDGRYLIEVPVDEIESGNITEGDVYRVGLFQKLSPESSGEEEHNEQSEGQHDGNIHENGKTPPVSVGEIREVEIFELGEYGDGITTIDGGFVVFVPGGMTGDRLLVRVSKVKESFAFAEILKRLG